MAKEKRSNPDNPTAAAGGTRHLKIKMVEGTVSEGGPIKGGMKAEDTARGRYEDTLASSADKPVSYRFLYVLARKDADGLKTPLLETQGNGQKKEVMLVFTDRPAAISYLQTTRWPDYEVTEISPQALGTFCQEAQQQNINTLAVNPGIPGRPEQQPSSVLELDQQPDLSGENLFREIWDLAEGVSVSSRKP